MTIRHHVLLLVVFFGTVLCVSKASADERYFIRVEQVGGWYHWTYPIEATPIEIDPVPAGDYRFRIVNTGDTDVTARATGHIWIMGFINNAHSMPFLVGSYEFGAHRRATPAKATELGFSSADPLIIWIHTKTFEVRPQPTPKIETVEEAVRYEKQHAKRRPIR